MPFIYALKTRRFGFPKGLKQVPHRLYLRLPSLALAPTHTGMVAPQKVANTCANQNPHIKCGVK